MFLRKGSTTKTILNILLFATIILDINGESKKVTNVKDRRGKTSFLKYIKNV